MFVLNRIILLKTISYKYMMNYALNSIKLSNRIKKEFTIIINTNNIDRVTKLVLQN